MHEIPKSFRQSKLSFINYSLEYKSLTASLNTTDVKLYARKYTGATQSYRIRLGGHATAYNTSEYNTNPVISFAGDAPWAYTANAKAGISGANRRNEYLYKIYGSLGRIFSGVPVPYMFYRTFYYCNELTGTIPDDLFSGISGQSAPYIFYETFLLCSGLTGSIPTNLFSNFTGAADYMFRGTFAGCYNLGKDSLTMESAYYIPPTLFAGLAPDPLVQDPMSYVFESTGLWQSCPTGTNQAITGFEDAFDNRVSCIDSDYLYCRKEFKYDTGAKKCVACDKSVETCPTFGAIYKCPDDYAGNSNSTECIRAYTITYHLNGGVMYAPQKTLSFVRHKIL